MATEHMPDERIYADLAAALDRLPNGFPRTSSGVELQILREIFSPEDAFLAAQLERQWKPVGPLAAASGMAPGEVQERLFGMAKCGLVWLSKKGGDLRFRLAPFVIGIYEAQLERMDAKLARLIDEYMDAGGALGIMSAGPALHRVVPAHAAIKPEWVLPYDDVRAILDTARSFYVRDCVCRVHQSKLGQQCPFPLHTCLTYFTDDRPHGPGAIGKDEAIAVLDEAERLGLVHTVSNVQTGCLMPEGIGYVCNCCGCCCMILRGITKWGIASSVAHSAYWAEIDAEACTDCGACIARCQVHALVHDGEGPRVDRERCIGCGLCVSGCQTQAARLRKRPAGSFAVPPLDFEAWQEERSRRREG